jgi:hypothetical protein
MSQRTIPYPGRQPAPGHPVALGRAARYVDFLLRGSGLRLRRFWKRTHVVLILFSMATAIQALAVASSVYLGR